MPASKYTKEILETAVKASRSLLQVLECLNISKRSGGSFSYIRNLLKKYEIDTKHFKYRGVKYTKEMLEAAVSQSNSIMQVMRLLNLQKLSGGSHSHVKRMVEKYKIDISHFTGQGHLKGKRSSNRLTTTEILCKRTDGRRQKAHVLRRALLDSGVEYICANCKVGNLWYDKSLTLEVDHINGDFTDDQKENLRFLCPNCHSQCVTNSRRKKKEVLV